jgi:hypothetical protein
MGKPVNAISNSNANFKLPPKHNILINHENHLRASKAYNNQPAANTGLHINNFPSTSVSFNKQKLVGSTNNTDRNLAASPNRPGLATQTIIN